SRPLSLLFPFSVNAHISPLFPYTTLFRSRDDLDALGRIRRLENRIAHPVDAAHGPLVEADLLERAADALHDVALDRRDEPLRVDHEPAVVRDEEALRPDAPAAPVDFDLADRRDVRAEAAVDRNAAPRHDVAGGARARRRTRLPSGELLHRLQNRDLALVGQQRKPELDRINAGARRDLVEEALLREV